MIVRLLAITLILSLISAILIGQTDNSILKNKTVLFKITIQNSEKASYLFGTHHAFGKAFFDSLTKANQALVNCDLLIKENLAIPGGMAEDIINQRETITKWNRYLGNKDLIFIDNLFDTSPTDFNKMTPTEMYVFLNRYFKQQVCLKRSVRDSSLSLDDYISSIAIEQGIALLGLETIRDQIDLINKDVEGMPRKKHKKRLASIIDIIRTENSNYCQETDWYTNMKIDLKLNEPCRNFLILTERNNNWMITIKEKLASNNCFIAVGLSHLMYECGLINQLRERGYIITPIEVN